MEQLEFHGSVGILSHGQLAMMMGEAGNEVGIHSKAIGPGENSPASYAIQVFDGDYNNPEDVKRFVHAEEIGSLVFDTDHVTNPVLHELTESGFLIVPHPRDNDIIRNRIKQKEALQRAGLPLIEWRAEHSKYGGRAAFRSLGGNVIFKEAEGGFDGRGNIHVDSEEKLEEVLAQLEGRDFIVERFMPIDSELAVMLAQDVFGNRKTYPVVESFHKDGMLEYTFYPSLQGDRVDREVQEMGIGLLENVTSGAALIGMEVIRSGTTFYVNEFAGRPHNTGHMTIEACVTSQFENLLRIASFNRLGDTDMERPGQTVLMHNLNGGTLEQFSEQDHEIVKAHGGYLHDYHKARRDQIPPRKRAHMTLFGPDRDSLMRNARSAIEAIHFFA